MSIPAGWSWARFSEVARIAANLVDPAEWPHLPHIAPDNIARDTGKALPYRTVREDGVTSANHRFYPGQLLYSKIRPYLNKCIRVDFEGLCSADMYPVDAFIDSRFLHHYMLTRQFVSEVSAAAGSRTVLPKTNQQQLANVPVPVAPLAEQHRIADAIDSYVSRVDAAVANLERVQAKLKAYRASVLKAAVEGRLVPNEAALARAEKRDYEPAEALLARILGERRRRWEEVELSKLKAAGKTPRDDKWKSKYQEPAPPKASNLVARPEGWCWASPEQVSSTDSYSLGIGPFGSNLKVSDYTTRGTPLIFVRNIRAESFVDDERTRYVSPEKALALRPHQVAPGDILVTKMGDPPGDCCQYPVSRPVGIITADCIKLRIHAYLPCVPFFVHAMRSGIVQSQIQTMTKGVAQKKVSLSRFSRLALPLPPATEQQRIADELDRLLSVADQASAGINEGLRRCARLRQAILKWAFEGKLADQDPRDESAEKLLARIRAESAAGAAKKAPSRTRGAA